MTTTFEGFPLRYLVFVGRDYYPSIPPGDFLSSHPTLEAAVAAGIAGKISEGGYYCWYVVCSFDGESLIEVAQG
jgi:hypothetical protein